MVLINEWLPNPAGKDSKNEWVELWNNGKNPVNLSGWKLQNKTGKSVAIGNIIIQPDGYAVIHKIPALRNTDESIALYDASGLLADRSAFLGTAVQGKSYSRMGSQFMLAIPTPGAANQTNVGAALIENVYPTGVPIGHPYGPGSFIFLAVSTGLALAAVATILIKKYDSFSHLFFG